MIIGNNDLSSFSGFPQTDDRYQAMVTKVHDDTLRAGKIFGQANATYAKGHPLSRDCQILPERPIERRLDASAGRGGRSASAPPPGEEDAGQSWKEVG